MFTYTGSIEDVLASGEYDVGDQVVISYDELFDLAEQGREWRQLAHISHAVHKSGRPAPDRTPEQLDQLVERFTNRPIHPTLGGPSPYSEFLRLGFDG